ncbi:hypothetical protein [Nocardia gipuzkoensis]|uniref:hypothetical protein n=1 Tax=Nocardia gipuzkoensis TaxID=2749991 RepID=UPI00237E4DAF|nr:hypothetical protein [Nocardia gipuzkoensis]MDE1672666.1 hypothetical protein [Nocardia gipuzkoensis]
MLTILAAAALVLILAGIFLPVIARWGGFLLMLDSLLSLIFHIGHSPAIALLWLSVGVVAWLIGHLIEAHRNDGLWRSWLAMQTFRLPGLHVLRPPAG